LVTASVLLLAPSLSAQEIIQNPDWCRDRTGDSRDNQAREARQYSISARDLIRVDAEPNGGITVEGWDRDEIQLQACVSASSRDGDPEAIIREITVETGNTIQSDGPRTGRRESWSVSFRLMVPRSSDLDLESHNGGIHIAGVHGDMDFETRNGGINLRDIGGDVRGRTQNGGLDIELSGSEWDGNGLDVVTTNGGVELTIPGDYRATLETGTVNGGFDTDFPITIRGRLRSNEITTELNGGGPRIRVKTTNGGVRIREG
jgi:hypothetical protein